jgi:hypothetical protein
MAEIGRGITLQYTATAIAIVLPVTIMFWLPLLSVSKRSEKKE